MGTMTTLPKIGSKQWQWTRDRDESETTLTLDTPIGVYTVVYDGCGESVVRLDREDSGLDIATFDMFGDGTHDDERGGTTLDKAQTREALRTIKCFCELDARRRARKVKN